MDEELNMDLEPIPSLDASEASASNTNHLNDTNLLLNFLEKHLSYKSQAAKQKVNEDEPPSMDSYQGELEFPADAYDFIFNQNTFNKIISFVTRVPVLESMMKVEEFEEANFSLDLNISEDITQNDINRKNDPEASLSYFSVCLLTNSEEILSATQVHNHLHHGKNSSQSSEFSSDNGKDEAFNGAGELILPVYRAFNVLTSNIEPLVPYESFRLFLHKVLARNVETIYALFSALYRSCLPNIEPQNKKPRPNKLHILLILEKFHSVAAKTLYEAISSSKKVSQNIFLCLLGCVINDQSDAHLIDFTVRVLCPSTGFSSYDAKMLSGGGNINRDFVSNVLSESLWKFAKNLNKTDFMMFNIISRQISNAPNIETKERLYELYTKLVEKLCFETVHGQYLLAQVAQDKLFINVCLDDAMSTDSDDLSLKLNAINALGKVLYYCTAPSIEEGHSFGYDSRVAAQQGGIVRAQENNFLVHKDLFLNTFVSNNYLKLMRSMNQAYKPLLNQQIGTSSFGYLVIELTKFFVTVYEFRCGHSHENKEKRKGDMELENNLKEEEYSILRSMAVLFVKSEECCVFHNLFRRVFLAGMKNDIETDFTKVVLQKNKFLAKLTNIFSDNVSPNTSLSAHVLILLNIVRLVSQSQQTQSFLVQFLKSHATYRSILPTLKIQTETKYLPSRTDEQSVQLESIDYANRTGFQAAAAPKQDVISKEFLETGIDLGSKFASNLGLEGMVAFESLDQSMSGSDTNPFGTPNGSTSTHENSNKKKRNSKDKKKRIG